jgi:cellulose synthase/poly-beta-1,6-N-acetylglucosamine synthase-like glycosyltransferase
MSDIFDFLKVFKEYGEAVWLYLPLGIIGAWRWGWWLVQKTFTLFYRPVPVSGASPYTLSVVTPVYNEDPALFRQALESWKRNRPEEIIAVIDSSDRRCIEVFEEFARKTPEAKLIVTEEPGKRQALARGVRAASGDVVALADSDTLWEDHVREILLAPFADGQVGGTGPRQAVLHPDSLARRLFAMRLDLRYLHEIPYLAAVGDALTCLSGRTAFYRRSAIIGLLDDLVDETFLGQPCISGDDKRLTSLIQAAGWKVRYQQGARVWTHGMRRMDAFLRQYIRWTRNSWRTDLKVLASGWVWRRETWLAIHLADRFLYPLTMLLGPIALGLALSLGHWAVAGVLIVWWLVSRTVKLFPHLRESPRDIVLVPAYVFFTYVFGILRIYALLTLDFHSWITRWDKERMRRFPLFARLSAYGATLSILAFLTAGVWQYREAALDVPEEPVVPMTQDIDMAGLQERSDQILANMETHQSASYVTRGKYTLERIRDKYNVTRGVLGSRYPDLLSPYPIPAGVSLAIPVGAIRNTPTPAYSLRAPRIAFNPLTDTIEVRGSGSVVTLSGLSRLLGDPSFLERQDGNVWILRHNLYIGEGVTLIISGNEVSWLKLKSDPGGRIASIQSYDANVLIQNTKITSWDEGKGAPDTDYSDGRSYILARANGRMDVLNSEVAYLGYPRSVGLPEPHT